MKKENQSPSKQDGKRLNIDELTDIEKYKDLLDSKVEIIGWLDIYSYFFADWSVIINESVLQKIEKKQLLGLSYENEQKMLNNLNYFLSKVSFLSDMLSEWHEDLALSKALTEHIIKKGNNP